MSAISWVASTRHSLYCESCSTRYDALTEFRRHPAKNQHSVLCAECLSKQDTAKQLAAIESEQSAARKELARRELIRRRLINFTIRFVPGYNAGWVHKLICAKLERFVQDVEMRNSPRTMFFQPPRTGKSTIVSRCLPAWVLGKHPDWEFISASYAVDLPLGFSRWIKNVVETPEYQAIYPQMRLDPNAKPTSGWFTTKGGMYLPVGVGGGATGKGAHVFNIDDPVKDAAEADSETTLQSIWDWWDAVADTRVAPGGGVIVTMTRWSDLDLAGRLQQQEADNIKALEEQLAAVQAILDTPSRTKAQDLYARDRMVDLMQEREDVIRWDTVVFPALAEHDEYITEKGDLVDSPPTPGAKPVRRKGEALHPVRYDEAFYRRKRKSTQKRFWNALFQQKPVPDDGDIFKRTDFRFQSHVRSFHDLPVYGAWDLAIGQKNSNDWTVGLFGVLDYQGRLHLINRVRVRTDELAKLIYETSKQYRGHLALTGIERGQIQMSIMPGLLAHLNSDDARENGFTMAFDDQLKPITDKVARARPAQSWAQQGKVVLPGDQPWVDEFLEELLRFPNGVNDDQVDAFSWLVRMVSRQSVPQRKHDRGNKESWKDKLKVTHEGGGYLRA